jgi:DNA-directed RNA polymerase subunit beta'
MSFINTNNNRILEKFKESIRITQFNAIKISIASPEKIKAWTYGEVKKIETINYRTFRVERDGLFCPKIFGPTQDWACVCGKYKRIKHRGIVCEKCGVEVIESRVRRERMGHIDLVKPVVHIWYLRETPSYIPLMLNLSIKEVERVIYFEAYIVTSQGNSPYAERTVLAPREYFEYIKDMSGDDEFAADMGAEPIKVLLEKINISFEIASVKEAYASTSSQLMKAKLRRRLKILTYFLSSKIKPEWMVLTVLPVLPPDLRPLVPLEGGRFASSDLNELYRRVINRNLRLKRLIDIQAPSVIIKNEQRILQESVDALIDNSRRLQPIRVNKKPLKSLSEMLRGKQGRFRQNLLGKRVDYSARSVIIVDPTLRIDQCGLPKMMVLELFKSFVLCQLIKRGIVANIRLAKKMIVKPTDIIWEILEDLVENYPVILNRAPTLHRLGIQAFYPKLIDSKAITIHPMVTVAFGADFDGDQMAVYLPLSKKAIEEARSLMLSSVNLLSSQNSKPAMIPHQEMVLGIYYLTKVKKYAPGYGTYFSSLQEVITAAACESLSIHAPIFVSFNGGKKPVETTVGRVLFYQSFPSGYDFAKINKVCDKRDLVWFVEDVYHLYGRQATVAMLDSIKSLGFKYATKSGFTFAYKDLIVPDKRSKILGETEKTALGIEESFAAGDITAKEKKVKLLQAWDGASTALANNMFENLEKNDEAGVLSKAESEEGINFLYACLASKSRGSKEQVKQIIAMRGLMLKPSGEIIEHPVKSNFKDGLNIFEYFISTHGARKGQADTALKTANAGYLTRRLVDVAQDIIVTQDDCLTEDGVVVGPLIDNGEVVISLCDRIYGRVLAEDITDSLSKKVIFPKGKLLLKEDIDVLRKCTFSYAKVRSARTCISKQGVCALCYGADLSKNELILIGSAVGIVAAQSIGEPGTQLTLRTFHIGGTASFDDKSFFQAKKRGRVSFIGLKTLLDRDKKKIVTSRKSTLRIFDEANIELQRHDLEYGSVLSVSEGQIVEAGDKLAEWDTSNSLLISEFSGKVKFFDIINGATVQAVYDKETQKTTVTVTDIKNDKYQPSIVILDDNEQLIKQYALSAGTILTVNQGGYVEQGDILGKIPLEIVKSKDITTGGLPKIAEFFEARMIKNPCTITEIEGEVTVGVVQKGARKITITNNDEKVEYLIPKKKQLLVSTGDFVSVGDHLTSGNPVLQDILRINGLEYTQNYLVNQLQLIYKGQGQNINDKHFDLIVRQMTRKVKIIDPGDTTFLEGDKVDRVNLTLINKVLIEEGKKPARYSNELIGITPASLGTESFFAAASFQETTRVLAEAAIAGSVDYLRGLKENVIIGRKIPAGTGVSSFEKKVIGT